LGHHRPEKWFIASPFFPSFDPERRDAGDVPQIALPTAIASPAATPHPI